MNKNELVIVNNVRGYVENEVAYLNLEDVARGLGWTRNDGKYVRWERVEPHFSKFRNVPLVGQRPEYIEEGDFYMLAMVAESEVARKFQDLVCYEVLPSIRKHGMYATDDTIENMINNPDFAIQLLTKLKEERAEKLRLEAEKIKLAETIERQQPKVMTYDNVFEEQYFDARELASMLNVKGLGRNKLLAFLRDQAKVLDKYNSPYRKFVDNGCCKQVPTSKKDRFGNPIMKTLFTDKMLQKLIKIFKK